MGPEGSTMAGLHRCDLALAHPAATNFTSFSKSRFPPAGGRDSQRCDFNRSISARIIVSTPSVFSSTSALVKRRTV